MREENTAKYKTRMELESGETLSLLVVKDGEALMLSIDEDDSVAVLSFKSRREIDELIQSLLEAEDAAFPIEGIM